VSPRALLARAAWCAVVAGAACHRAPKTHPEPVAADTTDIPLDVTNHNWLDVTIYVVRDDEPVRLGVASAASEASFTLPARLIGQGHEIRLLGHPIGGAGGTITETVTVQPGQWIEWTLENDLSRSAIGVY